MLAVQTADENLFVPDEDIASLTPVYPNRTRVVLADGTVAHRPGPPPPGPWVPLHDSWVNPRHLSREGDHWKDPGDYLYPYLPLRSIQIEEEETDLPEGLIVFEMHGGEYFWRTDTELLECDLKPDQALQIYPQLCPIGQSHLVYVPRIRRFGARPKGGWIQLDNGERFDFGMRIYHGVAQALGSDTLVYLDRNQAQIVLKVRDFPYDLTTHDPERIRRDCPDVQSFTYNLLWQTVLQHVKGQPNDYGRDLASYTAHPLTSAAERCGYEVNRSTLVRALSRLVHHEGLFHLRQLSFSESDPDRRTVGTSRSQVLLIANWRQARDARLAADHWGLSMLVSKAGEDRLPLENLSLQLESGLHLLFYGVTTSQQATVLRILEQLEMSWWGDPIVLGSLLELENTLHSLPKPMAPPEPEPFRRIPLQASKGTLRLAEPAEIACWSPTLFNRWRVTLADGQVLHHPGPVPPGPWTPLEKHWAQPHLLHQGKDPAGFSLPNPTRVISLKSGQPVPCPPDEVLWLEQNAKGACWHLVDGRQLQTQTKAEEVAVHHAGLVRIARAVWVQKNRIRTTAARYLQMDGGVEFPLAGSRFTHQLKQMIGVPGLDRLAADDHGLLLMGLRDFPFEIARAPASVLSQFFPTPDALYYNILYQSYDMYRTSGVVPYGKTFSQYFYRPLQATLYRLGFLTRAQFRAPMRPLSAKERLYFLFARCIFAMVYRHKLFSYRQFGFKDPFPEDRTIGAVRPAKILLIEKGDQVEEMGLQLAEQFGLTMLILKGTPSLLASEYFADELKNHGIFQVEVFFYGDFDYAGWDIGPAFLRHLHFYGVKCTRLARLVLPECFVKEELPLVSRAIPIPTPTVAGRVKRWLQEGGGIAGQARGIHANWLFPYDRLASRLEQLL